MWRYMLIVYSGSNWPLSAEKQLPYVYGIACCLISDSLSLTAVENPVSGVKELQAVGGGSPSEWLDAFSRAGNLLVGGKLFMDSAHYRTPATIPAIWFWMVCASERRCFRVSHRTNKASTLENTPCCPGVGWRRIWKPDYYDW